MTNEEIKAKLAAIVASAPQTDEYIFLTPEQERELGIVRRSFIVNDRSDFQRIRDTHLRP